MKIFFTIFLFLFHLNNVSIAQTIHLYVEAGNTAPSTLDLNLIPGYDSTVENKISSIFGNYPSNCFHYVRMYGAETTGQNAAKSFQEAQQDANDFLTKDNYDTKSPILTTTSSLVEFKSEYGKHYNTIDYLKGNCFRNNAGKIDSAILKKNRTIQEGDTIFIIYLGTHNAVSSPQAKDKLDPAVFDIITNTVSKRYTLWQGQEREPQKTFTNIIDFIYDAALSNTNFNEDPFRLSNTTSSFILLKSKNCILWGKDTFGNEVEPICTEHISSRKNERIWITESNLTKIKEIQALFDDFDQVNFEISCTNNQEQFSQNINNLDSLLNYLLFVIIKSKSFADLSNGCKLKFNINPHGPYNEFNEQIDKSKYTINLETPMTSIRSVFEFDKLETDNKSIDLNLDFISRISLKRSKKNELPCVKEYLAEVDSYNYHMIGYRFLIVKNISKNSEIKIKKIKAISDSEKKKCTGEKFIWAEQSEYTVKSAEKKTKIFLENQESKSLHKNIIFTDMKSINSKNCYSLDFSQINITSAYKPEDKKTDAFLKIPILNIHEIITNVWFLEKGQKRTCKLSSDNNYSWVCENSSDDISIEIENKLPICIE